MDAVVSTGGMALRPLAPYVLGQNRAAGAEVVDLRPELADYFGVEGGVLLVDVPSGTPAAQAGLQPGDVVTHVDRNAISTVQDLRIGIARGDVDLTLTIVRKGQLLELLLHRE
jgi:serine protease DegS